MRMTRQGESLVVETPAKLNLHLEVLGRRLDGFHDLETVMLAVSLTDTLRFTPSASGRIEFRQRLAGRSLSHVGSPPTGDDNLVVRAARRLADETSVRAAVAIELCKRIPWQAGMGGGSSDAAATLLALNLLWDLQLPRTELHRIAATLGSDLNFFIAETPLAVCRGRGEVVEPRPLRRRLDIVVAQPEGGLSTADVFRHWNRAETGPAAEPLLAWLSGSGGTRSPPAVYNALQSPAEGLHGGVAALRRALTDAGLGPVAMTGSGSACFGLCRSRRQALAAAARLRARTGCRAWALQTRA